MKKIIRLLGVFAFALMPIFLMAQGAEEVASSPYFTNDAVVLGILICLLGLVFWTDTLPAFKSFYKIVPTLLLCYFLPAILNSLGIISGEESSLYYMARVIYCQLP